MKAFVTGGTGFLGTHIVQELDRAGWDIVALHRKNSDLRELKKLRNVEFRLGDITDRASLRAAMPEAVDAVFHTAGSAENLPHAMEHIRYAINRDGTRNVVDTCLEKKIGRLIYTSTVLTYDFHAHKTVTEDSPPNDWCKDPYIHSKRLADNEIRRGIELGLDIVSMHPSAVFGAYDKATWSKMFLEIERGLPLPFAPPGGGSVCHALKVARAHVDAWRLGGKGEHYILGGPDVTWLQVAKEIANLLGKRAPIAALPTFLFKAYGWTEFAVSSLIKREPMLTPHTINILTEHVYSDSGKALKTLGYRSSSLHEMLSDCYRWMVAEGMLDRPLPIADAQTDMG